MKKNTAKFVVKALVCTGCVVALNNYFQYPARYQANPIGNIFCTIGAIGTGLVVGSYASEEVWSTVETAMNYISKLEV